MIKDRDEASNIISNIKYPPIGSRGCIGIAQDNYYRGGIRLPNLNYLIKKLLSLL